MRTIDFLLSKPVWFAIITTFILTEIPAVVSVLKHPQPACHYDGIKAWPTAWLVCRIKGEK